LQLNITKSEVNYFYSAVLRTRNPKLYFYTVEQAGGNFFLVRFY